VGHIILKRTYYCWYGTHFHLVLVHTVVTKTIVLFYTTIIRIHFCCRYDDDDALKIRKLLLLALGQFHVPRRDQTAVVQVEQQVVGLGIRHGG